MKTSGSELELLASVPTGKHACFKTIGNYSSVSDRSET